MWFGKKSYGSPLAQRAKQSPATVDAITENLVRLNAALEKAIEKPSMASEAEFRRDMVTTSAVYASNRLVSSVGMASFPDEMVRLDTFYKLQQDLQKAQAELAATKQQMNEILRPEITEGLQVNRKFRLEDGDQ